MSTVAAWFESLFDRQVDVRPVAIARLVLGVDALLRSLDALVILYRALNPERVQLPYWSWMPDLTQGFILYYIGLWWFAAALFAIGVWTRYSGLLLAGVMGFSLLIDQQTYSNHLYLLIMLVILISISGGEGRFSLDARHGKRRTTTPYWGVFLLRVQLSIVYFFGAVSKINSQYLSGEVLAETARPSLPAALLDLTVIQRLQFQQSG